MYTLKNILGGFMEKLSDELSLEEKMAIAFEMGFPCIPLLPIKEDEKPSKN
jgi:hypothetical protein